MFAHSGFPALRADFVDHQRRLPRRPESWRADHGFVRAGTDRPGRAAAKPGFVRRVAGRIKYRSIEEMVKASLESLLQNGCALSSSHMCRAKKIKNERGASTWPMLSLLATSSTLYIPTSYLSYSKSRVRLWPENIANTGSLRHT